MTDPISDFLTRLRNAFLARKKEVVMPYSRVVQSIADILLGEGFVEAVDRRGRVPKKELVVRLKYIEGKPAIENLRRVSKPGGRYYLGAGRLRKVKGGLGISIVSTSSGIMTGFNARKKKIGGEIICEVW